MAVTTDSKQQAADNESRDDGRNESPLQRLDRNTVELLNELRVAGTGVQVMFAFLLTVPFSNGYRRLSSFDRIDYFVTLACVMASAALLIAPSIHHRILFAQGEKRYLVRVGNNVAIAGIAFLLLGFVGIFVMIANVMFGGVSAAVFGALTGVGVGGLWFAVPLRRRARSARHDRSPRRVTSERHARSERRSHSVSGAR
jgi:hypothetical protein